MCDFVGAAIESASISRRRLLAGMVATAAAGMVGWRDAAAGRGGQAGWRNSRDTHRLVLLGTAGGPPWWTYTGREGIASAVVVGDRLPVRYRGRVGRVQR